MIHAAAAQDRVIETDCDTGAEKRVQHNRPSAGGYIAGIEIYAMIGREAIAALRSLALYVSDPDHGRAFLLVCA